MWLYLMLLRVIALLEMVDTSKSRGVFGPRIAGKLPNSRGLHVSYLLIYLLIRLFLNCLPTHDYLVVTGLRQGPQKAITGEDS